MLQIFNSMTRKKEPFTPRVPGHVGLYVCGITVYDQCHLGHGRSMVCFDVIVRYLQSQGFTVNFIRNITDIDDKIIARAQERNISINELTSQYIDSMHADMRALNLLSPNHEPRATEYIEHIIKLIERLIASGNAYISANGDVCFQVDSFKEYGKLSNKDLDGLLAGARIEIVKEKRSPLDFVLWKKAKSGEPYWASPWGDGRPGWHIECSAMAIETLGEQFDIHGGGLDLQFPHHENEIAQSEAATQQIFANYWMHVGMLQIDNIKMSKSLNNFFTLSEVLKTYHPEVVRYFLLSSHYRSQLNYSPETLDNACHALTRLYQTIKEDHDDITSNTIQTNWIEQFNQAMDDDFNTPEALAVLFRLSREINKRYDPNLVATLRHLASILGLLHSDPSSFLQAGQEHNKEFIEQMIAERLEARKTKNWSRADQIRTELLEQGIELEDTAQTTLWRKIKI